MDIMISVRLHLIGGALRIVRFLATKVDARTGYSPVLYAGFSVLAMKFAIDEVSGVPECRRPDLLTGPLVTGQYSDLSRRVADPVGVQRGSRRQLLIGLWGDNGGGVAPSDHAVRSDRAWYRHTDWAAAFNGMGLAEENQESFLGEERLQTRSAHSSTVVILDNRGPVRAFGQPDRLRRSPEPAAIGFDAGVKLAMDRGVAGEERQVSVGGCTGGDFGEPFVLQRAEGAEQVAAESVLERREHARVPVMIEASQIAKYLIARPLEAVHVLRCFGGPFGGVGDKVIDDYRIGKLLTEDRSDADGQPEWNALFSQVIERVQQRDIGLGNCLMNPLLAVRPHPRLPGIRKMTMQHEGEGPDWRCHVIPPYHASRYSPSSST